MTEAISRAGDAAQAAPAPPPAAPAEPDVRDWLPQDLRGHDAFGDVKDVGDLAARYADVSTKYKGVEHLMGKRAQELSADDAQKFYALLGRPKDPGGYRIDYSKVPEGMAVDQDFEAAFRTAAHKANLLPDQVSAVTDLYIDQAARMHVAAAQDAHDREDAATGALKETWGAAYDQKLRFAQRALQAFGGDDLVGDLKTVGVLGAGGEVRAPRLAMLLATVGEQIAGDGALIGRGAEGFSAALTPDQARQAWGAKQRDPEFMAALLKADHPGHAAAVRERDDLYRHINPPAPNG